VRLTRQEQNKNAYTAHEEREKQAREAMRHLAHEKQKSVLQWLREVKLKRLRFVRDLLRDEHGVRCQFSRGKILIYPVSHYTGFSVDVMKNGKYVFLCTMAVVRVF